MKTLDTKHVDALLAVIMATLMYTGWLWMLNKVSLPSDYLFEILVVAVIITYIISLIVIGITYEKLEIKAASRVVISFFFPVLIPIFLIDLHNKIVKSAYYVRKDRQKIFPTLVQAILLSLILFAGINGSYYVLQYLGVGKISDILPIKELIIDIFNGDFSFKWTVAINILAANIIVFGFFIVFAIIYYWDKNCFKLKFKGIFNLNLIVIIFVLLLFKTLVSIVLFAGSDAFTNDIVNIYYTRLFYIMLFLSPILEEIFFRGILLEKLLYQYKPFYAILFSSILFGFMHPEPINTAVFGIFLGWLYFKTESLILTITAHFINNLLLISFIIIGKSALVFHFISEIKNGVVYFLLVIMVLSIFSIFVINKMIDKSNKYNENGTKN